MRSPSTLLAYDVHGAATVTPVGIARTPLPIRTGHIGRRGGRAVPRLDLHGARFFPGLVNAHDHLHVNAVPPLPPGAPFPNAYAWIEAFDRHFHHPAVGAALAVPKEIRLRHGALKNLLAGTTSVAHHDPWHRVFDTPDFPVHVLRDMGWSYALGWPAYGPDARDSFLATPADRPWMIHLAEGTDAVAHAELATLQSLGCLAPNSVLVHGVGLGAGDIAQVVASGAAVVWCPASNLALLGRTLDPRVLFAAGRLALGTDSRLSGARDLLEEMRGILERGELDAVQLQMLATAAAARILRLPGRGRLATGDHADFVVVADDGVGDPRSLAGAPRSALRAVVRDGAPCIADPDLAEWFALAGVDTVHVLLDGRPKLMARWLDDPDVIALEPGLERMSAHDAVVTPALRSAP
jgi:cytosine/adenosine deaminase-related metal-dependent hydrolase